MTTLASLIREPRTWRECGLQAVVFVLVMVLFWIILAIGSADRSPLALAVILVFVLAASAIRLTLRRRRLPPKGI